MRPRIPAYRRYNPKNLGLVVIDGKQHYLGKKVRDPELDVGWVSATYRESSRIGGLRCADPPYKTKVSTNLDILFPSRQALHDGGGAPGSGSGKIAGWRLAAISRPSQPPRRPQRNWGKVVSNARTEK